MPLIRRTDKINLWPEVVSLVSPVLDPTVKPENVIVPAAVPFVIRISHPPSAAGAVMVIAELHDPY